MNSIFTKMNWYKGNLHTHTTLSDGKKTPDESIALYREKGYDFLDTDIIFFDDDMDNIKNISDNSLITCIKVDPRIGISKNVMQLIV